MLLSTGELGGLLVNTQGLTILLNVVHVDLSPMEERVLTRRGLLVGEALLGRTHPSLLLQLPLSKLELILSDLQMIGCTKQVLEIDVRSNGIHGLRLLDLITLLNRVTEGSLHELGDFAVGLLNSLPEDLLDLELGHLATLVLDSLSLRTRSLEGGGTSVDRKSRLSNNLLLDLRLSWHIGLHGKRDNTTTNLNCFSHFRLQIDGALGENEGAEL